MSMSRAEKKEKKKWLFKVERKEWVYVCVVVEKRKEKMGKWQSRSGRRVGKFLNLVQRIGAVSPSRSIGHGHCDRWPRVATHVRLRTPTCLHLTNLTRYQSRLIMYPSAILNPQDCPVALNRMPASRL